MSASHQLGDGKRRKIIAAAGLLASSNDGEIVAAARATSRLLATHGLRPEDVFRLGLEGSETSRWRELVPPVEPFVLSPFRACAGGPSRGSTSSLHGADRRAGKCEPWTSIEGSAFGAQYPFAGHDDVQRAANLQRAKSLFGRRAEGRYDGLLHVPLAAPRTRARQKLRARGS